MWDGDHLAGNHTPEMDLSWPGHGLAMAWLWSDSQPVYISQVKLPEIPNNAIHRILNLFSKITGVLQKRVDGFVILQKLVDSCTFL